MSNQYQATTYYEILGVAHDAPIEEIKRRYRELSLKFHPDREGSAVATVAMALINEAYEYLSDPQRRAAYDIMLSKPPEEPRWSDSPQARQEKNEPWGIEIRWEIRVLFVLAISVSCVAGYFIEPTFGSTKIISDQFTETNRHFLTAIIHEVLSALPVCIPVFGMAWDVPASFFTGVEDKAVVISVHSLPAAASATVVAYALIAMTVKAVAYYVGICRSYNLARLIRRRRFSEWDKFYSKGEILLVIFLSAVVGWVEFAITNVR